VPEALRGARLGAPRLAVLGLLLVVLVAAVGFGARVAWARVASTPRVVGPGQPSGSALAARGAAASAFTSTAPGPATPTAGARTDAGGVTAPGGVTGGVTVHVVGQVRHAGVFRLPAGSRVSDAIARAGGATRGADLAAINLARALVDGEQVRVPKPGEAVATPSGPQGAATPGATGVPGVLVNLNTATQAQLEELPGVGPVLAQRILDWRSEHGRFTSVDELGEVSGIGEKIFAQLQPKVTV
jgi:competence protein ComEA